MQRKKHMDKSTEKRNNINDSNFDEILAVPEKTAADNQWVSTGILPLNDNRERRDGPGGENSKG